MEKSVEIFLQSKGPREQEFVACEKMASVIYRQVELATTDVNGKRLTNPEEITEKLNRFLPMIDELFDQASYVPQGIVATESSFVKLGLQTGHLVTENPIENWYADAPGGHPTPIYFFWEAPRELTYQMSDHLKEKRNEIRRSLNLDEQATAGSRRR